jgi:hypothetical protein
VAGEDVGGAIEGRVAGPVAQAFGADEHKRFGDDVSGGRTIDEIVLDDGSKLTFGDLAALAADHVESVDGLRALAKTRRGQQKLRWARWWKVYEGKGPEPAVDEAIKKEVKDDYYRLAADNVAHFSEGGTAKTEYETLHAQAMVKAITAGLTGASTLHTEAITDEAFGQHYLGDLFSGGHIRTPRAAMKGWYSVMFPGSIDDLIHVLAERMYDAMKGQMPALWRAGDFVLGTVVSNLAGSIRASGGKTLTSASLGDLVSKAYHDHDNLGLWVVSDCDPSGAPIAGGFHWRAKGDGELFDAKGNARDDDAATTIQMTEAAMKASLDEIDGAYAAATAASAGGGGVAGPMMLLRARVESIRQRFVPPKALSFVPRPDPSPMDGANPELHWRWGQMNDEMVEAFDKALRDEIIPTLLANVPEPAVQVFSMYGDPVPVQSAPPDADHQDDGSDNYFGGDEGDYNAYVDGYYDYNDDYYEGLVTLNVADAWQAVCSAISRKDFEEVFGPMQGSAAAPDGGK